MPNDNRASQPRRLKNVWVYAASGLLAVFTTFVLLDTFAIARVQQVAEAADFSSIVAAQSSSSSASADSSNGATSTDSEKPSGTTAQSNAETAASTATTNDSTTSSADRATNASSTAESTGQAQRSTTGQHRSRGSSGSSSTSGSSKPQSGKSGKAFSGTPSNSSDAAASTVEEGAADASTTGTQVGTYTDDNMSITVSKVRAYDTDIYVADIQVSSAEYLKTALAQNAFGRNLKDTTSNMAEQANAVLAVNGDYYGFRDYGYVLRNGVLYRSEAASDTDALVVYGDGTMAAVSQDTTTAEELKAAGAWQVLSFGPTLVSDGELAVSAGDEVDQSMGSNPRTAIGMVSPLHYVVVVSDGRTDDNAGLSLNQLAQVLVDNGATFAYNLDGGGSTTMYFQGEVLNSPTSGNRDGERQVSDIVYFG